MKLAMSKPTICIFEPQTCLCCSTGQFESFLATLFSISQAYIVSNMRKQMSRVMGKHAFCICDKIGTDQQRSFDRTVGQHLCFSYIDSTIPLLPKVEISSLQPSSVVVQTGLCRTWLVFPQTGFLMTQLKYMSMYSIYLSSYY